MMRNALCVALVLCVGIGAASAELQTEGRLEPARSRLKRAQLDNDFRYVVRNPPQRYGVTIHANSRVRFAYANTRNAWLSDVRELDLVHHVAYAQREQLLMFRVRHTIEKTPVWHDLIVPLATAADGPERWNFPQRLSTGRSRRRRSCSDESDPRAEGENGRPEPVLISIDTLRADHQLRGLCSADEPEHRPRGPRGCRVSQAVASSNWTSAVARLMPASIQNGMARSILPLHRCAQFSKRCGILVGRRHETGAFTGGGLSRSGWIRIRSCFACPPWNAQSEEHQRNIEMGKTRRPRARTRCSSCFAHLRVHPHEPPAPYNLMFDPGTAGHIATALCQGQCAYGKASDAAMVQRLIAPTMESCATSTSNWRATNYVRNGGFGDRTCVVTADWRRVQRARRDKTPTGRDCRRAHSYPAHRLRPTRYAGGQVVTTLCPRSTLRRRSWMAGAPLPKDIDGRSLEPALLAPLDPKSPSAKWMDRRRAARRRWRCAPAPSRSSQAGRLTPFDLTIDPGERRTPRTAYQPSRMSLPAVPPLPSPAPSPPPDVKRRCGRHRTSARGLLLSERVDSFPIEGATGERLIWRDQLKADPLAVVTIVRTGPPRREVEIAHARMVANHVDWWRGRNR
jgi:hypothetical protein